MHLSFIRCTLLTTGEGVPLVCHVSDLHDKGVHQNYALVCHRSTAGVSVGASMLIFTSLIQHWFLFTVHKVKFVIVKKWSIKVHFVEGQCLAKVEGYSRSSDTNVWLTLWTLMQVLWGSTNLCIINVYVNISCSAYGDHIVNPIGKLSSVDPL